MPNNRFNELQRQRALVQEHLEWLDRQIATEAGQCVKPTQAAPVLRIAPTALPAEVSPTRLPARESISLPPEARMLVTEYEKKGANIHNEVKRGCILYLIAAFALVGVGVFALYLYSRFK